jgi:hypothetical protein
VADNLDNGPATLGPLIGGKGLETIPTKQPLVGREHIRALAILAENPDGYTRAMMLGHGFSLALTASLIRAGFATDHVPNRSSSGGVPVARVRITDAGRQALAEHETSSL